MSGSENDETEGDSESGRLPEALRADPEAKTYIYRDFASLPEDPNDRGAMPVKRGNSEISIRVQKFPLKVSAMTGAITHDRGSRAHVSHPVLPLFFVFLALCYSFTKGV